MDRGAHVNVQDIRGYSPLLYAAGADAMPVGIVKMLIAKGADQNAKGDGETARMLAAKRGDSEVARLLGVPDEERKLLGVAPTPEGSGRERLIPDAVKPALALLNNRATTSFVLAAATHAMPRICHQPQRPSHAIVDFLLPS